MFKLCTTTVTLAAWCSVLAAMLILQVALNHTDNDGQRVGEEVTGGLMIVLCFIRYGCCTLITKCCRCCQLNTTAPLEQNGSSSVDIIEPLTTASAAGSSVCVDEQTVTDHHPQTGCETLGPATLGTSFVPENVCDRRVEEYDDGDGVSEQVHRPRQRIFFLDNLKIFLTALVVAHHVNCAFGGCGKAWFLVVGGGEQCKMFHASSSIFAVWNQSYFMSLFFFISAYFTPTSYRRKGSKSKFMNSRAKRWLLPAIVVTYGLSPLTIYCAFALAGLSNVPYIPAPAHSWFLYWLLLLNWVYASFFKQDDDVGVVVDIQAPSSTTDEEHAEQHDGALTDSRCELLPATWKRMLVGGALVCGIGMLAVVALLYPSGGFGNMPISTGSLTCDLFMFYMGLRAQKRDWLTKSMNGCLRSQLDISAWALRCIVVVEVSLLGWLMLSIVSGDLGVVVPFFVVAGLLTVDMSTALLEFFQTNLDMAPGRWTQCASGAAYCVYLIHPLVVVGWTGCFVFVYNASMGHDGSQIEFDDSTVSETPLSNGIMLLASTIVHILSQITVWPLAYCIREFVPGLKNVL